MHACLSIYAGEVMVADFRWIPPRPVRFWSTPEDARAVDIAWSVDSSRIAAVFSTVSILS